MSPQYDVFLSHSSADKPEVEFLAGKLKAAGITPFLDKWNLIPGEPWQEALEEALDESRTCAVFVGPKGIGPWQNREMRSAIEDRPVIPVLLPGSPESHKTKLSRFLRQLTWVEFRDGLEDEDAFHRLIAGVKGIAPGSGSGGARSLHSYRSMAQAPEEFIDRREYEQVLRVLCPKGGIVESGTSIGITTALRGAGGFGKTALAQKLCQEKRVQETYPDGILWATMGEDIDANGRLSRIRDLIRWWTREESPAFETTAAAGARLRELLSSSRVLIVIDDVWSSADVTPFQGIGNGSALLITTRVSQTLPSDSKRIEVDAMASTEAVELLRSGLADGEEQGFHSLARRLGEWPLLLKMVNRQIRELVNEERHPIQDALQEINEALNSEGFAAFDRDDPESRHAAASRTILVSVQRLQENEREKYFQLAVFSEDARIPFSVLERLWRVESFPARKLCRRLHALSLLLEFNSESETVRLHDVVRQVLLEQKRDQLPGIHRQLLDAFRPPGGSWSDLPNEEKYLWRNLAGHLLGADHKDELRRLLTDLSFLQAKLNTTDINALMADYQNFAEEDRELRLIRDALRLSAHILALDRQQLAVQLVGRLVEQHGEGIEQLLNAAKIQLQLMPRPGTLIPAGGALIRTLEIPWNGVETVVTVDSRRVISASGRMVRVWDLDTGEILRNLEEHSQVEGVAVVDNCRAVSVSAGRVRVWNLDTGETLRTFERRLGGVSAVVIVDDRRAVSAADDCTLRVWDLETGEISRILMGHSGKVCAVAMVDARRAVSASADGALRVWDLDSGESLRTLEGHSDWVYAVSVVDDRRVISASNDRTLRVWDLDSGETLQTLKGHSAGVFAVSVVDDRRAVSASKDRKLRVWDLDTGETLQTLEGHSDWIYAVSVVAGRRAVSASTGMMRVWDLDSGEPLRTLEGHSDWVHAVSVVDSRRAVSASADGTLRVWDLDSGETLQTLQGHSDWVYAVSVVDNRRVVSASADGTLRVWDLDSGETLQTLKGHSAGVFTVSVVNGDRAVSASEDLTLRVWDLNTGETLFVLKELWTARVRATVAVIDDHRAVSASGYRRLRLWDLDTGETLLILEGHLDNITSVAVIDDRRVVSASNDRTLQVWDLDTGESLRTLQGHSESVTSVAVVDGRQVVSASSDRTVRLWDLETGKVISMITLDALVLSVAYSLERKIVIAGDSAGKVHFLDLVEPG